MKALSRRNPCLRCVERAECTGPCARAREWMEKAAKRLAAYERSGYEPWELTKKRDE